MNTPQDFLEGHMGPWMGELMYEGYEEDMWSGMYNAQDLAFCTNWSDFEKTMNRRAGQKKRAAKAASAEEEELQSIIRRLEQNRDGVRSRLNPIDYDEIDEEEDTF